VVAAHFFEPESEARQNPFKKVSINSISSLGIFSNSLDLYLFDPLTLLLVEIFVPALSASFSLLAILFLYFYKN
jgi:hypothetical protein